LYYTTGWTTSKYIKIKEIRLLDIITVYKRKNKKRSAELRLKITCFCDCGSRGAGWSQMVSSVC
jgi:hypothetical protein